MKGAPRKEVNAMSLQKARVENPSMLHRNLAMLVAFGWSNNDIGKELDLTPARVSIIKNSPSVIKLTEEYRARIEEKAIAESMAFRLREEFHKSMDTLAVLRDTSSEEQIQLSSAKFLVEKAVDATIPKKTINEERKKVGVVVLNGDELRRLSDVMSEVVDVSAEIEVVPETMNDGANDV